MTFRERNNIARKKCYIKQIERKYTDNYEQYSIDYHREKTNHTTWWWRNIPEIELEKAGFINDYNKLRLKRKENQKNDDYVLREYGLDGLAFDSETNTYHGIQSKYWKSRKLTSHDLGSFLFAVWSRLVQQNNQSCGYLYHTCDIQIDAMDDFRNNPNLHSIKLPYSHIEEHKDNIDETKYPLRQPQIEALNALSEGWDNCGLLTLPCGLGKTVIIGNYLKNQSYKHIFFLSPLRQQTKQSKERIEKFIPQYMSLLVDSDNGGTTDETYIFDMIEKQSCFLSITYESFFNIFASKIGEFEDSIIVVDEAHNIIGNDDIHHIINDCQKSLLVTATPTTKMDENIDCQVIYEYSMRDAIENNYICDYNINIPLIDVDNDNKMDLEIPNELKNLNEDLTLKSLFLIDGLLKTGSSRCIVYCNSIDECKEFNDCFQETCDKYHGLKCWTSLFTTGIETSTTQKREDLLNKFSYDNEYKFYILTSVRILNEGIDIVECDSTFISNVPNRTSNEICAVQRMCRSNRKSKININKVSQCFIWCSDMNKCMNMLQYLKYNDETHFFNKITVRSGNYQSSSGVKSVENAKLTNYKKTFVDYIKIKSMSSIDMWKQRLDDVRIYIDENDKFPSSHDKNYDIKRMGRWAKYNKYKFHIVKNITENPEIYNLWNAFIKCHEIFFSLNIDLWKQRLDNVKIYIDKNNQLPIRSDENDDVKRLNRWVIHQRIIAQSRKQIMKNPEIYDLWTEFIEKYKKYFLSNEKIWLNMLDSIKMYIDKNKKLPTTEHNDDNSVKQKSIWLSKQKSKYKDKLFIMKNEKIYDAWKIFIKEYEKYFLSEDEIWFIMLNNLETYIEKYNKLPLQNDEDKDVKTLNYWLNTQKSMLKKHTMKQTRYDTWNQFIVKQKDLFVNANEKWFITLNNVKLYIEKNDKLPSKCNENDNYIRKLGEWLSMQNFYASHNTGAMKNRDIYDSWTKFKDKYKQYYTTPEEDWLNMLNNVKLYVSENGELPSLKFDKRIYGWINRQKRNYKTKTKIMKNPEIYDKWTEFISTI
jgi:superfamily II DNA or RNA helicase